MLPDELIERIVDRTDGVPLFVEELTKSVLESGILREAADRYVIDRALPPLTIPTNLRASLRARLDRLGPVRDVAQIGAAIGREFSYELLHAVSRLPEDELQIALARLVSSELVFQRGTPPDAVYAFKHALVQDAAHESLLRRARQQMHAHIAEALEAHSPELMESQPELFARHYAEAGLAEKSVAYWGKAGRRSVSRSAMAEAASQLQNGLDQLALLPDNRQRWQQELELRSLQGAALRAGKGIGAAETGQAYARAHDLWKQLGSPLEFIEIPWGQSRYHMYRGEWDQAQSVAEDLLCLSPQRNDAAGLVLGHYASGLNLLSAGRFALSRMHLEEVLALYDPASHSSLAHQTGSPPRVGSQGYLGIVLLCLGFPDQALARSNAAIAEARSLDHPPSLAAGLVIGTRLLCLYADYTALNERSEQLIAVAIEQGFPSYRAMGTIYRGWVKVNTGEVAEGISVLRRGLSDFQATGTENSVSYYVALLARATEIAGQVYEALTSSTMRCRSLKECGSAGSRRS